MVGELRWLCVGEKEVFPVPRQNRERRVGFPVFLAGEALCDLVAQQGADPRDAPDQFIDTAVGEWRRGEEVRDDAFESVVRDGKLSAAGLQIPYEVPDRANLDAETVDRPVVPVGVQDVGQGLDLLSLLPVMVPRGPLLWIDPPARPLQLYMTNSPATGADGEVGSYSQSFDTALAVGDQLHALSRGHAAQQVLHRCGEALLLAADRAGGALKLGSDLPAELGDEVGDRSSGASSCPAVPS
ncbi:hypothetical protein [Streptomyces sp. NPDC093591]|uniref:hypothetical protein n=1 Tax=Streptomyces sp. NPDC093591 TaxID=3366044 RepID=UPI00381E199D